MSGYLDSHLPEIFAEHSKKHSTPKDVISDLVSAHKYTPHPRFGGELEIMCLRRDRNGDCEPAGYNPGMRAFLDGLIEEGLAKKVTEVEGQPVRLELTGGEVICFEKYAAFIERADTSYSHSEVGLLKFARSIDAFASMMQSFSG